MSLQNRGRAGAPLYFGKYPGKVVSNQDDENRGRLFVSFTIGNTELTDWALPAMPYAGPDVGFFALPPAEANVWVEFAAGDSSQPIWTGCFWNKGDLPKADAVPELIFLKTPGGTIRMHDTDGITIERGDIKITLTDSEITIAAPQVTSDANGSKVALSASGYDVLQGAMKVV